MSLMVAERSEASATLRWPVDGVAAASTNFGL
jgi:hypothetical protein